MARLGLQDGGEPGIVGGAAAGAPRHAKGDELGVLEFRRIGEEAIVGRIGARPAALDVVDAQEIELAGDGGLVGHGEIHALGLGAVAQGGVEEIEPVGHAGGIIHGSHARASGRCDADDGSRILMILDRIEHEGCEIGPLERGRAIR